MANQEIRVGQYRYLQSKYRKVIPPDLTAEAESAHPTGSNFRQKDISTGLEPFQGSLTNSDRAHLLKRTLFGVSKKDLDTFSGNSLPEMLNTILTKFSGTSTSS